MSYMPPKNCLRIKSGEEFSTEKIVELADSHDEVFAGEGHVAMMRSIEQQDVINSARTKTGDIIEATKFHDDRGVCDNISCMLDDVRPTPDEPDPSPTTTGPNAAASSGQVAGSSVFGKRAFQQAGLLGDDEDCAWGGFARPKDIPPQAASSGQLGAAASRPPPVKKPKVSVGDAHAVTVPTAGSGAIRLEKPPAAAVPVAKDSHANLADALGF
jgi:hypothetical protein